MVSLWLNCTERSDSCSTRFEVFEVILNSIPGLTSIAVDRGRAAAIIISVAAVFLKIFRPQDHLLHIFERVPRLRLSYCSTRLRILL